LLAGEAGFGKAVNELELGCDCLGNIAYLDVFMNNDEGAVEHRKNAICIHEEDDGVLWKHKGSKTGKYADQTDMRRGTKLVVSSMSTIGNYEYGYYWYISLDGSVSSILVARPFYSFSPRSTSSAPNNTLVLFSRSSWRSRPPASSRPPRASRASRRSTRSR
jgi:hypothetical protein